MSLSPPAARRHQHTRTIVCEGFARDDGLWDIEASIVDTKTYQYTEPVRGVRPPGAPVHDMRVRLTLDPKFVVRDIEATFESNPYPSCLGAIPQYKALIGAQVGPGWRKAVQAAVGGTKGCTHIRELLFPMATVAFQTIGGWSADGEPDKPVTTSPESPPPYFIDGCRAWASDGEVVKFWHPQFYKPAAQAKE